MHVTTRDRRRFLLATTLTLLALPALWWVNRSTNTAAPNVAVAGADVGIDVGAGHDTSADSPTIDLAAATPDTVRSTDPAAITTDAAAPVAAVTPFVPVAPTEPAPGEVPPAFLEGTGGTVGAGLAQIAVPRAPTIAHIATTATYRSTLAACAVPGIGAGGTVTIVNVANGHSTTCTTAGATGMLGDRVTLPASLFAKIADLTDAPIDVEIRR